MKEFKFSMGQKVKLIGCGNDRSDKHKGKIGIVSAIYDREKTPGHYPLSDYRVTVGCGKQVDNSNTIYCSEKALAPVLTIKAFCFRSNKAKEYMWKNSTAKKPGYFRMEEFDIEKEMISE